MTRHLVDDGAFASLPARTELAAVLTDFHEILSALERDGQRAGMTKGWATVTVGDTDLGTFLWEASPADRDAAMLAMTALDHCEAWDEDPELVVDPEVTVDGRPYESYALGRCVELAAQSYVVACVTLGGDITAGVRGVGPTGHEVCFLVESADRPLAVRHRIRVEAGDEDDFFALAAEAFPRLLFARGVTFRKFEGRFGLLKPPVLDHLTAINDHFETAYRDAHGDLRIVSAQLGIDMSNEGNTRASERLMRERDATVDDRTYRCEIHSKIEPHRNRIHLHPADDATSGRVVIGHFVRHFTT